LYQGDVYFAVIMLSVLLSRTPEINVTVDQWSKHRTGRSKKRQLEYFSGITKWTWLDHLWVSKTARSENRDDPHFCLGARSKLT